jgi:5,10-methylenetetrahydromethanopterin reductase
MRLQLSCAFPPGPDVRGHARLAEELGYERVWVYDSPALYGDVWVQLAQIAEATERVGLGPAVLIPSLRHVLTTASAIATLEEIAPGRLAVAIGTGFTGRRMLGQRPLTWGRTGQYIADLKALLRGEQVVVDGKLIQMGHPPGSAPARPIGTPIVVAANGPLGLAVAKEHGEGVMCVGSPQPGFEWCAQLAFGTVFDDGEDADSERVWDAVGPGVAVIYHGAFEADPARVDALPGGRAWREDIERVPEAVRHLAVHEDHLVAVTARDEKHIGRELVAATFSGPPERVRERAEGLRAAGLTELVYAPMGSDVPRELRAMANALGS